MNEILYYSVVNHGWDYATLTFLESESLCDWDQTYQEDQWDEPCMGRIILKSESEIQVRGITIITKEDYLMNLLCGKENPNKDLVDDFIKIFFPEKLPKPLQEKYNELYSS